LQDLVVRPQRMARNLQLTDGLIVSEAVMMALAPALGRQRAHDVVYRAAMAAVDCGCSLEDALLRDPDVMPHLSRDRLQALLDPSDYLGLSREFVDRVLARLRNSADAAS
jgi:3-carboxy-cis,cis-muconate cycloisomerase